MTAPDEEPETEKSETPESAADDPVTDETAADESAAAETAADPDPDPEPVTADAEPVAEPEPVAEAAPAAPKSSAAQRAERAAAARAKPAGGFARSAKRYGPFVAVVILVAGAIAIFGGGGDDDKDDGGGGGGSGGGSASGAPTSVDTDELIRNGPMTWQKAELDNEDVDFGPNCDTETGRIKLPTIFAAPCVQPFEGDNGGATSPGVTEDEILIVLYQTDPALDPLGASIARGAGADVDPASTTEALDNYLKLYNQTYETYGRKVVLRQFTGTGAPDDATAAKADAITIAEMKPFAVIGGPNQQSPVFASELAARDVVCGPNCTVSLPEGMVKDNWPYLWQTGPTPEQAAAMTAEMVSKLAGPGKAVLAGDPDVQKQDRVYAVAHYDTADSDFVESFEALEADLADHDIELATDVEFTLDLARAQENARTIVSKLKEAGVTTVIYTGDPFTPGPITEEATAQDYHPEWILGSNVLADTAFFARLMDPDQWKNGFGISFPTARGEPDTADSVAIYKWAFGEDPPNNTVVVSEPPLRTMFNGIELAGPDLTPDSLADGLFRYPPTGGGPTGALVSRGDHGIWPDIDFGGSDDIALIWWDPTVSGEDEIGTEGAGLYRYAQGGQRYKLGEIPDSIESAGLFDDDSSVLIYDEVPAEDQPPDYPPPDLG
jgi:ABC-type branched-subunit amino acid transport system substrate-binding protein